MFHADLERGHMGRGGGGGGRDTKRASPSVDNWFSEWWGVDLVCDNWSDTVCCILVNVAHLHEGKSVFCVLCIHSKVIIRPPPHPKVIYNQNNNKMIVC